jgi:hypothetical protein
MLFGNDDTQAGSLRRVSRSALLESVMELRRAAKGMPGGFLLRVPPILPGMGSSVGGGGVSGLLIGGKYHSITCHDDHWTLQSIDDMREGKEATRQYEPAEIPTENLGTFQVELKKTGPTELSRLLGEIGRFVDEDPSDDFEIIWG